MSTARRRHHLGGRGAFLLLAAVLCALVGSTGAAAASTGAGAANTAKGAVAARGAAGAQPQVVRPFTGTGCHTYNYWNGAHVCITVVGNSLNMQSASGETDGPDTDWGKLWDTEGVITIWGHPVNHYMTVSWASGGGVWLANGDNMCFTDTTLNQTACLTMHL
ncbi:hypothetical protein KGA66_20780 [Actinocrinis puniceicyclus]|uniref:Uncharacterized protein n=1 Tax=Actinocrinis puniceicyclus TaxID=977794 RepID=A0A8J8BCU9_9ACTN|nr:hypothetical protein [Actinocrinis puniceicyclus]MBS2965497.1 hypothetical protein [Actinocrinis puniceicyclus]